VQEVASEEPGVRIFVVHSDERRAYEQAQRRKAMARVRTALEGLKRRVEQGRLKAPEKIGAAAARILAQNHGHRYSFPRLFVDNTSQAYVNQRIVTTKTGQNTPSHWQKFYCA
jgi:hypothetical protein